MQHSIHATGAKRTTNAASRPVLAPAAIAEREQRPDRIAGLLECMADLLVELRTQRAEITELQSHRSDDPRAHMAIARLSELERSLAELGREAASVHRLLQHVRLI